MIKQISVDHVFRLRIQMYTDGHQIRLFQQGFQRIRLFDTAAGCFLCGDKRIIPYYLHAKGGGHHMRYHLRNISHANESQRLTGDLSTLHFRRGNAGKRSPTHPCIGAIEVSTHFQKACHY